MTSPAAVRPVSTSWSALGCVVDLAVASPSALPAARRLLASNLEALDLACSRFRPDSELVRLVAAEGAPMRCTALLRDAVQVALLAAEWSDGLLDPTLGGALAELGYDRDFAALPVVGGPRVTVRRRASWRDISVGEHSITVPSGVLLDLGATAKAWAADRFATRLADSLGTGVLVSLGGDVAVAGQPPDLGWAVAVQDRPEPGGPSQVVSVRSGGLATSSTAVRRWQNGGQSLHHILDPTTLRPARSPWRTVSAVAPTCLDANLLTTTCIVLGDAGLAWLRDSGAPARLVAEDDTVTVLNGWPRI